jgi:S-adenosyl methyltransferase
VTDDLPEIPDAWAEHNEIDTSKPHSARIWNYWAGGTDNYPVDRVAGDRYAAEFPGIVAMARESRSFRLRVIKTLVREYGVSQFLDLGSGLPTADNVHEIAQSLVPSARIVYVDHDPLVLAFARTLLASLREGAAVYIDADVRDPATIVRRAAGTLDFTKPIALTLMGVMGHIPDDDEAYGIVRALVGAVPPGSFLVERDGVKIEPGIERAQARYNASGALPYRLRAPAQIARFFEGLELLEPGVVSCSRWRPDPTLRKEPVEVAIWGGVARKSSP